jgi:hypothetical protein
VVTLTLLPPPSLPLIKTLRTTSVVRHVEPDVHPDPEPAKTSCTSSDDVDDPGEHGTDDADDEDFEDMDRCD